MTPASPSSEMLAELDLDPLPDLEVLEPAVDDLAHQPDAVVELDDAEGVGRLVLERMRAERGSRCR